jgi:hypothetical protein
VNDAILQALGAYQGGRMLFLGLGTGVGSALVTEQVATKTRLRAARASGLSLSNRTTCTPRHAGALSPDVLEKESGQVGPEHRMNAARTGVEFGVDPVASGQPTRRGADEHSAAERGLPRWNEYRSGTGLRRRPRDQLHRVRFAGNGARPSTGGR